MPRSQTFTFKIIKPSRKVDEQPILKYVSAAMKAEAEFQKRKLQKTVDNWTGEKPSFGYQTDKRGGELLLSISPKGSAKGIQKWAWLNDGTPAHPIRARRAPALRFRQNYSASTRVGQFVSYPAGSWGDWRRPKAVRHPGIKARDWAQELSRIRQKPFRDRIFKAIKEGSKIAYG